MGTSITRCIVLGTPINEGEKCAIIFLRRVRSNAINDESSRGTFVLYSTDYMTPVSLPIWGKYDEYGFLSDIEENLHTERFKTRYGIEDWENTNREQLSKYGKGFHKSEESKFGLIYEIKETILSACFVSEKGYDMFKQQFPHDDYGEGRKYDAVKSHQREYDEMLGKLELKVKIKNALKEREEASKPMSHMLLHGSMKASHFYRVDECKFFRYFGINQGTAFEISRLFKSEDFKDEGLRKMLVEFHSFHHNMDYTSRQFITLPADLGGNTEFEIALLEASLEKMKEIKQASDEW